MGAGALGERASVLILGEDLGEGDSVGRGALAKLSLTGGAASEEGARINAQAAVMTKVAGNHQPGTRRTLSLPRVSGRFISSSNLPS